MRAIVRWMRVVFPPSWVIAAFLGCWLLPLALECWLVWWLEMPEAGEPFARQRGAFVGIACALYGGYRVLAFHPLFRTEYRAWLALTPWTSNKPLPVGPIHLVLQDAVLLGLMFAMQYGTASSPYLVPFAFLGPYLVALGASFFAGGLPGSGYTLAFGMALVLRLCGNPTIALGAAAILYGLAYVGIRRALARFPWQVPSWFADYWAGRKAAREGVSLALGWPFDVLQPKPPDESIGHHDAILVSLLAGCWAYAIGSAITDVHDRQGVLILACVFPCGICAIGRTLGYCWHHAWPISFWGRVFTLRWIIPGYDRVFLAPLGALLAGCVTPIGLTAAGVSLDVACPIATALVFWVTFGAGPSLKQWRLTGQHRLVPGFSNKQEFVEL